MSIFEGLDKVITSENLNSIWPSLGSSKSNQPAAILIPTNPQLL